MIYKPHFLLQAFKYFILVSFRNQKYVLKNINPKYGFFLKVINNQCFSEPSIPGFDSTFRSLDDEDIKVNII